MIVRKLRLQRSWSQEHLSEISGVSVRTIQRIERGQKMSFNTAQSLAAAFEVEANSLVNGDKTMNSETDSTQDEQRHETLDITKEEKEAIEYAKGLKEFYTHVLVYLVFAITFPIVKGFDPKLMLGLLGWGVGVVIHGLVAYEKLNFFSTNWEKKIVEKRLKRKL